MNWEQDAFATPRLQPPTPSATPRSSKPSTFEAANYETPRSSLATFESFFPFSTSPLQQISDSYERDVDGNATSTPLANGSGANSSILRSGELSLGVQLQAEVAHGDHGEPLVLQETAAALSSPVHSLGSHQNDPGTVVVGGLQDENWALMIEGSNSQHQQQQQHQLKQHDSQESMQTPPPTVSSAAMSPTLESKRRRGCSDEPAGRAATAQPPWDEADDTSYRGRNHDGRRPPRPRVEPAHFSTDILEAFGYPTSAPATAPSATAREVFWDKAALQSVASREAFTTLRRRINPDDSDVDGRSKYPRERMGSRQTLGDVTGQPTAARLHRAAARSARLGSQPVDDEGYLGHAAPVGDMRARTRAAPHLPQPGMAREAGQLHGSFREHSSRRSSQENSPVKEEDRSGQPDLGRGRRSFSQQRQRGHLKPRSNNRASGSLYGEVHEQTPIVKRRCTDQVQTQTTQPLERHARRGQSSEPASYNVPRETRRNCSRQPPLNGSRSSNQTSVFFTIDETGRAKAESKFVGDSASDGVVVPALWDVQDDDDDDDEAEDDTTTTTTTTDDDFDFTTSRNTSFAVMEANMQVARRRESSGYLGRRPQQLPAGADLHRLGPEGRVAPRSYSQVLSKRKVRHEHAYVADSYPSDGEVPVIPDSVSEAETVCDDPIAEETRRVLEQRRTRYVGSRGLSSSRHDKENRHLEVMRAARHPTHHGRVSSADPGSNAAIVCRCNNPDPRDRMIQCEACATWQHLQCMGLGDGAVPHIYQCDECSARTSRIRASRLQHRKESVHPPGALLAVAVPAPLPALLSSSASARKVEKRARS